MRILCILLFATVASGAEVIRVGRWEFHNSFWMNLHQTLMHDASTRSPRDLSALSRQQQDVWNAAVATYKQVWGNKGSITFSDEMMATQDAIGQIVDDAANAPANVPVADALVLYCVLYG
jgi:hypothetical protein